jgi:hypothetical protein
MSKPRSARTLPQGAVQIGVGVYGLPDGSVLTRPSRGPRAPQLTRKGDRPPRLKPGQFIWDNPPGPIQGVTFGLRSGTQYIGPKGLVTPTQAARLLRKSRVWIYKLMRAGTLRPVSSGGPALRLIPLRQIKQLLGFPKKAIRPICPGALWGYDEHGEPWLVG